jgi:UDP-N-acetylmuramoyl-L-alanyl-D-glutamate--2,6-diaminopimelate ligase
LRLGVKQVKIEFMSAHLSDLISIPADYDRPLRGLTLDSRHCAPGMVFFACQGLHTHGKNFIPAAIRAGVAAVMVEEAPAGVRWEHGVPYLSVPNLSQRAGELAARFYGHPSHALRVVGVTGTNGKTSITHFLAQSLSHASMQPCGLLGTLGYGVYGAMEEAAHTTPDALQLHSHLARIREHGARYVAMEVSSHALDQGRVNGVFFHTAVFTNLSRDHLDYHHTLAAYAAAKKRLFTWSGLRCAIINHDDTVGREIYAALSPKIRAYRYSITDSSAEIYCSRVRPLPQGFDLEITTPQGTAEVCLPLWGTFNIANALATLGALLALDMSLPEASAKLAQLRPVCGRLEHFHSAQNPTVIVDYAHTPDALAHTLQALRSHCAGRLWCVFGCGGARDRGKRPLMGAAAAHYADEVIITSDNPRTEDPDAIIADILPGMGTCAYHIICERATAIAFALNHATPADVVLIAGKGHETYQEIAGKRYPFSDRTHVCHLLGIAHD